MKFSEAVALAEQGKKVRRSLWPKDDYIYTHNGTAGFCWRSGNPVSRYYLQLQDDWEEYVEPFALTAGHYYETRGGELAFVASVEAPGPVTESLHECVGWLRHAGIWWSRHWRKSGSYHLNETSESSCDLVRDLGTTASKT